MSALPEVLAACLRAARDLGRRDILRQALWPPLLAFGAWTGVAIAVWMPMRDWLLSRMPAWSWLDWLGPWLVHGVLALLFAPAMYLTTLLLVAVVALPRMVNIVAARDYPDVARYGTAAAAFWGGLSNSLAAGGIFLAGWLLTLPLLLIPGVLLVLPLAWAAWLNQRTFRFDALAEHATPLEHSLLVKQERPRFWLAGLVAALAAHVPLLNLFAPAFAALVFVHLGFAALRRLRSQEGVWVSEHS